MSINSRLDCITPLFVAIDVSPEGEVVIIYDISMKAEEEGILSHLGIYVALIFGSIVWEAFTVSYKTSMEPYQYCPMRGCAIEKVTPTITFDDSFDCEFSKCGLSDDMINIPDLIELDPVQQIMLHIYPDIVGLLGGENGDSGMIRSDCSAAIIATSKTAPFEIINYLEPPPIPPRVNPAPPTVLKSNTTSKEDATDLSLIPGPTPSKEEALNNRPEESKANYRNL